MTDADAGQRDDQSDPPTGSSEDTPPTADEMARIVAGGRGCSIVFTSERYRAAVRSKFVVMPDNGDLVVPIPREAEQSESIVLSIPDEGASRVPIVEALVEMEQLDERADAGVDRWHAYHVSSVFKSWMRCTPQSIKHVGRVFERGEFDFSHPFAPLEARIVKQLNANRAAVRRCSAVHEGVEPDDPTVVGVDGYGVEIRDGHRVYRVWFDDEIRDGERAASMVGSMFGVGVEL